GPLAANRKGRSRESRPRELLRGARWLPATLERDGSEVRSRHGPSHAAAKHQEERRERREHARGDAEKEQDRVVDTRGLRRVGRSEADRAGVHLGREEKSRSENDPKGSPCDTARKEALNSVSHHKSSSSIFRRKRRP